MLFWFAGLTFVAVALIFASPAIDYRLVMLGAVAPTIELLWGPPWVMHTLLWPVAVMSVIMVLFQGRRLVQRRLLGLPIGFFFHLVLDASWARNTLFWWPGFGLTVAPGDTPWQPAWSVIVVMEIVGVLALVWAVRRFDLMDPDNRSRFFATGHLNRSSMQGAPG